MYEVVGKVYEHDNDKEDCDNEDDDDSKDNDYLSGTGQG